MPETTVTHRQAAAGALDDATNIAHTASLFALLGDPTRLRIMLALHRAPGITVGDLAAAIGITPNAASHALAGLADAGVAHPVKDGRRRLWSITDSDMHRILHVIGAEHTVLHPEHHDL